MYLANFTYRDTVDTDVAGFPKTRITEYVRKNVGNNNSGGSHVGYCARTAFHSTKAENSVRKRMKLRLDGPMVDFDAQGLTIASTTCAGHCQAIEGLDGLTIRSKQRRHKQNFVRDLAGLDNSRLRISRSAFVWHAW